MGSLALGKAINSFTQGALDFLKIYHAFKKLEDESKLQHENLELKKQSLEDENLYRNRILNLKEKQLNMQEDLNNLLKRERMLEIENKKIQNQLLQKQYEHFDDNLKRKEILEGLKLQKLKNEIDLVNVKKEINLKKLQEMGQDNPADKMKLHLQTAKDFLNIFIKEANIDKPDTLLNLVNNNDLQGLTTTLSDKLSKLLAREDLDDRYKQHLKDLYNNIIFNLEKAMQFGKLLNTQEQNMFVSPQNQGTATNPLIQRILNNEGG